MNDISFSSLTESKRQATNHGTPHMVDVKTAGTLAAKT